MIRVKDIASYFKIDKYDKGKMIMLYHPTEHGSYFPAKYVGHLYKEKEGTYRVPDGKPTSNKVQLLMDIEDYQKRTFKFNSEFYNPNFRPGYFVEIVVHDWLCNNGFKSDGQYDDTMFYVLRRENVFGLKRSRVRLSIYDLNTFTHEYKKKELPTKVKINLSTSSEDDSWISTDCDRTPEEIIDTIQSMLKPLYMGNSSADLIEADKLIAKSIAFSKEKIQGFNLITDDAKQDMIRRLKETITILES